MMWEEKVIESSNTKFWTIFTIAAIVVFILGYLLEPIVEHIR